MVRAETKGRRKAKVLRVKTKGWRIDAEVRRIDLDSRNWSEELSESLMRERRPWFTDGKNRVFRAKPATILVVYRLRRLFVCWPIVVSWFGENNWLSL